MYWADRALMRPKRIAPNFKLGVLTFLSREIQPVFSDGYIWKLPIVNPHHALLRIPILARWVRAACCQAQRRQFLEDGQFSTILGELHHW